MFWCFVAYRSLTLIQLWNWVFLFLIEPLCDLRDPEYLLVWVRLERNWLYRVSCHFGTAIPRLFSRASVQCVWCIHCVLSKWTFYSCTCVCKLYVWMWPRGYFTYWKLKCRRYCYTYYLKLLFSAQSLRTILLILKTEDRFTCCVWTTVINVESWRNMPFVDHVWCQSKPWCLEFAFCRKHSSPTY